MKPSSEITAGLTVGLCISLLLGGYAICEGDPASADTRSNIIEGVAPFKLDYDSGAMALYALRSCLEVSGSKITYGRLVALSGAAFKCVYDTAESYEPLRDLYPIDVLKTAAEAMGFNQAGWQVNRPIEDVKAVIKDEIDNGHPVITPFLKPDAYHGFVIITGYNYDKGLFYLQGAFEGESTDVSVPIPEVWDGPTASQEGWATNPIFVIGGRSRRVPSPAVAGLQALERGIELLAGGKLDYGSHPGAKVYMGLKQAGHAAYGLAAYDLLKLDVERQKLVLKGDGEDRLNFGFIWRIDAQIGQLQHDRTYGSRFLRYLGTAVPEGKIPVQREAALSIEKTADDAGQLRDVFWHVIPDTLVSAGAIVEYVSNSSSIVFRLPEGEHLGTELEELGFEVHRTLWGPLVLDDTSHKRVMAKMLVKSMATRDKRTLNLLRDLMEGINPDEAERPVGRPGQRQGQ